PRRSDRYARRHRDAAPLLHGERRPIGDSQAAAMHGTDEQVFSVAVLVADFDVAVEDHGSGSRGGQAGANADPAPFYHRRVIEMAGADAHVDRFEFSPRELPQLRARSIFEHEEGIVSDGLHAPDDGNDDLRALHAHPGPGWHRLLLSLERQG